MQGWTGLAKNRKARRRALVEPAGFEPATSSMPSRRAPNCATAPRNANTLTAFIAPCDCERLTNGAEIPCPNRGLDAAAINRALRRKYHIDRHHIHRPFEIPAKDAGEMIRRQDAAGAAAGIKKLRVVRFAQPDSAAAE